MPESSRELLAEITGCPLVATALTGPHPCSAVVRTQTAAGLGDQRQVPEPWSGHLETAPLLFVSSNPSISGAEISPRAAWAAAGHEPDRTEWPEDRLVDPSSSRLDPTPDRLAFNGQDIYARVTRDEHSEYVRFLSAARNRAAEAYEGESRRAVTPGADYCLTEAVHCTSRGESGVRAAASTYAARYLGRILAISPAPVIVPPGEIAGEALRAQRESGVASTAIHTVADAVLGGRERLVAFLPHPNRRGMSKTPAALPPEDRARLRDALARQPSTPGAQG